jgi:predicted SAM-dependent methyltransferase
MVPQWIKNVFHATAGRVTVISYCYVRTIGHRRWTEASRKTRRPLRLHLGSGKGYVDLPGYVNIDINPFNRKDIWLDVRLGLPFPSGSVDSIYCSHMLEHLFAPQAVELLRECYRVLRPTGGIRLVTPHLGRAIAAYLRNDRDFFSDFPDTRRSIGGRFVNHMLCRDQHRLMFDFSFMEESLAAAGFNEISEYTPQESRLFPGEELRVLEHETKATHNSLFVEATRLSE